MPEAVVQTSSSSSSPAPAPASATATAAPAVAAPAPQTPAPVAAAPAASAAAPQRPDGLPDTYWDPVANALKVDPTVLANDLKERDTLKAFKAADDSRRMTLPKADEFVADFPKDLKLPEGVTYELNKGDPAIARLRALGNKRGWDQETFSEALGEYAVLKASEFAKLQDYKKAEIAKLGSAGPARVDAVTTWIKGVMGEDAAGLAASLDYAPTQKTVAAFEKLMRIWSSQGGVSATASHRATPDTSKIPGFEKMSFEQRRQAQDQRAASGAR